MTDKISSLHQKGGEFAGEKWKLQAWIPLQQNPFKMLDRVVSEKSGGDPWEKFAKFSSKTCFCETSENGTKVIYRHFEWVAGMKGKIGKTQHARGTGSRHFLPFNHGLGEKRSPLILKPRHPKCHLLSALLWLQEWTIWRDVKFSFFPLFSFPGWLVLRLICRGESRGACGTPTAFKWLKLWWENKRRWRLLVRTPAAYVRFESLSSSMCVCRSCFFRNKSP